MLFQTNIVLIVIKLWRCEKSFTQIRNRIEIQFTSKGTSTYSCGVTKQGQRLLKWFSAHFVWRFTFNQQLFCKSNFGLGLVSSRPVEVAYLSYKKPMRIVDRVSISENKQGCCWSIEPFKSGKDNPFISVHFFTPPRYWNKYITLKISRIQELRFACY